MNPFVDELKKKRKKEEWEGDIKSQMLAYIPDDVEVKSMFATDEIDRHSGIVRIDVKGDPAVLLEKIPPITLFAYLGKYASIMPQVAMTRLEDDPIKRHEWLLEAQFYDIGEWYIQNWYMDFRNRNTLIWYADFSGRVCKIQHALETPIFEWYVKQVKSGNSVIREVHSKCKIPKYEVRVRISNKHAEMKVPTEAEIFWDGGAQYHIEEQ